MEEQSDPAQGRRHPRWAVSNFVAKQDTGARYQDLVKLDSKDVPVECTQCVGHTVVVRPLGNGLQRIILFCNRLTMNNRTSDISDIVNAFFVIVRAGLTQ